MHFGMSNIRASYAASKNTERLLGDRSLFIESRYMICRRSCLGRNFGRMLQIPNDLRDPDGIRDDHEEAAHE